MGNAVLDRVMRLAADWPEDMQATLADIVAEMDAGLRAGSASVTPDELAAIDEGLADIAAGRVVRPEEIEALFDRYCRG